MTNDMEQDRQDTLCAFTREKRNIGPETQFTLRPSFFLSSSSFSSS